jgi:cyclophilin family peptidyl-prolyl cis-trans isomerase
LALLSDRRAELPAFFGDEVKNSLSTQLHKAVQASRMQTPYWLSRFSALTSAQMWIALQKTISTHRKFYIQMRNVAAVLTCLLFASSLSSIARKSSKKDYIVTISTSKGVMRAILFDETPKHKANFIKLSKDKFYNGLLFHRVMENFMIQGGDPNSRNASADTRIGNGDIGYKLAPEFKPNLFHQKGALAAARDNNPTKESSGCQFYIVEGRKWSKEDLAKQAARAARKPTAKQREIYQSVGGTPHLDGAYTVFGQVIDGLPVINKIAMEPRDERDRPTKNIAMKIAVKKMNKKKITRKYGYKFEA